MKIRITYLFITIVILATLLLSGGCNLPDFTLEITPSQEKTPVTSVPATAVPTSVKAEPINPAWTPPPVAAGSQLLPDFVSVIAKVKPSVVAISTKQTYDNWPFGTSVQEGSGSGWIISKDGYIVTNNHVVADMDEIEVTLDDQRTYPANNIRTDSLTDLAVLKIDADNLPALQIGDSSDLKLGEWVVAIGNSMGLGTRATKGIVSSLGASIPVSPGQTISDLIQIDAAINPGNSGGPLVNMKGEVIGINSIKIAEVGVEGMGYSISINTALPIIESLITNGFVVRPWLGVGLYTVDMNISRRYNLGVEKGAIITQIAADSPADKAGLKVGDVITSFGGKEISTIDELLKALHSSMVGETVEIVYWRNKAQNTTSARLAQSPAPDAS